MRQKIAIHQPEFLPWLGFFHKLLNANKFVILDIVQYNKQDYQNRNKVVCNNKCYWVTVPLIKHSSDALIKDILICNNNNWQEQMKRKLYHYYFAEDFYDEVYDLLSPLWNRQWYRLADLNVFLIKEIMCYLQINTELYLASEIIHDITKFHEKEASDKNMLICQVLNANCYISGVYGKNYLDVAKFAKNDIEIEYVRYPINEVNYSIIDSLFKYGKKTRDLL